MTHKLSILAQTLGSHTHSTFFKGEFGENPAQMGTPNIFSNEAWIAFCSRLGLTVEPLIHGKTARHTLNLPGPTAVRTGTLDANA